MKLTCFSYFEYGFKIKASVMHEHVKNTYEHSRTFKHIQGFERIMELTCFSYFGYEFKIKDSAIHDMC